MVHAHLTCCGCHICGHCRRCQRKLQGHLGDDGPGSPRPNNQNMQDKITGASSPVSFLQYVPTAYTNIDVEVDRVVRRGMFVKNLLRPESRAHMCFEAAESLPPPPPPPNTKTNSAALQLYDFRKGSLQVCCNRKLYGPGPLPYDPAQGRCCGSPSDSYRCLFLCWDFLG